MQQRFNHPGAIVKGDDGLPDPIPPPPRPPAGARRARPLLAALVLVLAGCRSQEADAVTIRTRAGAAVPIGVEIVATPEARSLGLMYRDRLALDAGMLFVFPQRELQSFWMRNTKISLDILFIDDSGEIVRIHRRTTPFSEAPLPSERPVRFVLEVEGGFADRHGLAEGDRVELGSLVATPAR